MASEILTMKEAVQRVAEATEVAAEEVRTRLIVALKVSGRNSRHDPSAPASWTVETIEGDVIRVKRGANIALFVRPSTGSTKVMDRKTKLMVPMRTIECSRSPFSVQNRRIVGSPITGWRGLKRGRS